MAITRELRDEFLKTVSQMLDEPDVEVFYECGVIRVDKGDDYWHFEPNAKQKTLTIKTSGGARETTVTAAIPDRLRVVHHSP
jgi:hypothetical protein